MAYSMTGYGRFETLWQGIKLTLEMKSVNHRFCEVVIRSPRHIMFLEEPMKRQIQGHIQRGRIELYITCHNIDALVNKKLQVDWELAEALIHTTHQLKERFDLAGQLTVQDLLGHEGLFQIEEELNTTEEALSAALLHALEQVTLQLKEMRQQEGLRLVADLQQRLQSISKLIMDVKELAPRVKESYAQRLEAKLREFMEQRLVSTFSMDDSRLLTEIALFAEKTDIDEELIRLASHTQQFEMILTGHEEAIGRKLDFLVQEMNREVNTIGSKVNDSEIRQLVVEVKSQLEKIKEQIQNLE